MQAGASVSTKYERMTLLHLAIAANGPFSSRDEELKPMVQAFLSHGNFFAVAGVNYGW